MRSVGGVEIERGVWHDLTNPKVEQLLQRWLKSGSIWFVWWATPCTPWSKARHGKPACEHKSFGAPVVTVRLMNLAHSLNIKQALENPKHSDLWSWGPLRRLLAKMQVLWVHFPMCAYGARYLKWTSIATTLPELQVLSRRCCCSIPHEILQGKVRHSGVWVWKTSLARCYPPALALAVAACLVSCAPPPASGVRPPCPRDINHST